MYANTNLVSICQCFETNTKNNSNLCMIKFVPNTVQMEMRRHVQDSSKRDINCNQFNGKVKKPIGCKNREYQAIRSKFPTKIPIIVTRYAKETNLPHLDRSKFLVPQEITLSQFLIIIRHRMKLRPTEALYLLVNNRSMLSLSSTLAEVHTEFAAPDGFLYIKYASQEVFGCDSVSLV